MQKEQEKFLRIGDYVTFANGNLHGMLCAEGILVEQVILRGDITTLDDALYCVHLQRQYSAAREYEEFMASEHDEIRVCPHRGAEIWSLHAIAALDPHPLAESGRPWMSWVQGKR